MTASSTVARIWEREILSRLLEIGMRGVNPIRHEVVHDAKGRVLEIGFGTGVSLPHYGDGVRELIAVEPAAELAAIGRDRLTRWASDRQIPATMHELSATRPLPIDEGSIDAVVILFVLCSVDRLDELLSQVGRLLRPGGALHLAEHVAADNDPIPHPWRERAQRAIRPAWRLALGGCDPHRSLDQRLTQHGFDISMLSRRELDLPWPVRSGLIGRALRSETKLERETGID